MTLLAGYYELRRDTEGGVEIAYFGLLPEFIGRGLGGALLTSAIEEAWSRHGGIVPITRLGAYVQPRSPAGARELSGARNDRLQGRGRALGRRHPSDVGAVPSNAEPGLSAGRDRTKASRIQASCACTFRHAPVRDSRRK